MALTTIILAVLTGVLFTITTTIAVVAILQHRINWLPVPSWPDVKYVAPADVTPEQIRRAFELAQVALMSESTYGPDVVLKATAKVFIIVKQSDSWVDLWGRKVAGLQEGNWLSVGHNLAGLCHEMAHLVEEFVGLPDPSHLHWRERGVYTAIEQYEGKLAAQNFASDLGG